MTMSTKNLIPISYVKQFTPLVKGDELFYKDGGYKFTLKSKVNAALYNNNDDTVDKYYSLVSFADRTNTGKQPVDDDVVVDTPQTLGGPRAASELRWVRKGVIPLWKPNHAAMLAKFKQGANTMNTDSKNNHIAITIEALGSQPVHHIDLAVTAVAVQDVRESTLEQQENMGPGLKYHNIDEDGKMTPVFTQEMADAGELPPIGSKALLTCGGIFDKNLKEGDEVLIGGYADFGGGNVAVFCKERGNNTGTGVSNMFKPIDNRSDEEKAIDAMIKAEPVTIGSSRAADIFKAIKTGDIPGVKWVGK